MISALGGMIRIDTSALEQSDRDALHRAWADAAADPTAPADAVIEVVAGMETDRMLSSISRRVTRAAIAAHRGALWMLHAGAVADDRGRVVVVIGPSGRGKTTATRTLARQYAYVTDETVAVDDRGVVHPYRKPLSIIEAANRVKAERAPRELGLGELPAVPLRLAALVLLDRRADGPDVAFVDTCNLGDVLHELVEQSSHLAAMPHPLRTIAALAESTGGIQRVVYREAETLAAAFAPLFRDPTEVEIPVADAALSNISESTGGWYRMEYLDALELSDPTRIAVVQENDASGQLRIIDGIGPALWRAAAGHSLAELVSAVVAEHGAPAADDPALMVEAAIAELADQGLLHNLAETDSPDSGIQSRTGSV